jgi:hypothetical protein
MGRRQHTTLILGIKVDLSRPDHILIVKTRNISSVSPSKQQDANDECRVTMTYPQASSSYTCSSYTPSAPPGSGTRSVQDGSSSSSSSFPLSQISLCPCLLPPKWPLGPSGSGSDWPGHERWSQRLVGCSRSRHHSPS